MTLRQAMVAQFGRPSGFWGAIAGEIMAYRPSNRERAFRTLDLLDIEPGDRILEIGFGPGVAIAEGRVELRPASVDSLPEFSESFDRIFAINSIGFWNDPVECLMSLREHLEPGGLLGLTVQPRGRNAGPGSVRVLLDRLSQ